MTSAQTALAVITAVLALAVALGVAWAVFRSASEQKVREIDKQLISSLEMLKEQQANEIVALKEEVVRVRSYADGLRADLTQKAAVDHLLELVVAENKRQTEEHDLHMQQLEIHTMLLRDIIAQLKKQRGEIGDRS